MEVLFERYVWNSSGRRTLRREIKTLAVEVQIELRIVKGGGELAVYKFDS